MKGINNHHDSSSFLFLFFDNLVLSRVVGKRMEHQKQRNNSIMLKICKTFLMLELKDQTETSLLIAMFEKLKNSTNQPKTQFNLYKQ